MKTEQATGYTAAVRTENVEELCKSKEKEISSFGLWNDTGGLQVLICLDTKVNLLNSHDWSETTTDKGKSITKRIGV